MARHFTLVFEIDHHVVHIVVALSRPQILEGIDTLSDDALGFNLGQRVERIDGLKCEDDVVVVLVVAGILEGDDGILAAVVGLVGKLRRAAVAIGVGILVRRFLVLKSCGYLAV